MRKKTLFIFAVLIALKVEAQSSTFSTIDQLIEQGRYKLALQKLDEVEKPSYLSNYKKATIYESIESYKNAAKFYELALTFKEEINTQLKLSKIYQLQKHYTKAIKIYEEITKKDSLNLILRFKLGKLFLLKKRPKKAIQVFKFLEKEDIDNASYSYYLALSYASQGDGNRMINSLLQTYKKDTLHLKAIAKLASGFKKTGDVDSTLIFVEKGLKINKNHINLNRIKINQLYREKKYAATIPLLLNLDTIDAAKETYSKEMLGRVYYNLDSLEKAEPIFRTLTRLDRENFKAYTYLGHIFSKQKNYKLASMYYLIATYTGKSKRDEEYYGLATIYYEQQKPKKAIETFKKAHFENSKNYRALYQYAKLSDDFYKDKKIAYKLYVRYLDYHQDKDEVITRFVKKRIKEIKSDYFLNGKSLK